MDNKFIISLFFVFIFSFTYVMAFGLGVPHQFYGDAIYNGAAANGLTIGAFIDGNNVGTTTTLNGRYGYEPVFYISDSEAGYEEKTITFYLNGIETGQTAVFENGASTRVDLSVGSAPSPAPNPSGGGNGGGNGGGGGGGRRTTPTITTPTLTTTGNQDSGEDDEESDLGLLETTEQEPPKNFFSRITGAVVGSGRGKYTIPLIFIILIVVVAIGVYVKRKN